MGLSASELSVRGLVGATWLLGASLTGVLGNQQPFHA